VSSTNGWQDPDGYEALSWKLKTARGEHVRQRRLQAVLRILDGAISLLDVGAGPATLSKDLPCSVVACDLSIPMLKKAKQRVGDVIRCDAEHLPFRDKSFDTSFESSCLYLVMDKEEMVKEMRRISRRRVIVFESNRLSLRRLYDKHIKSIAVSHEHPTPNEVSKYMVGAGLSPRLRMVGFSPTVGGSIALKVWEPVEWFVESCPGLRMFAGGILAYADIAK
jgi:ubiquinone/menaquinone biosynthesis C-methylase UbiE